MHMARETVVQSIIFCVALFGVPCVVMAATPPSSSGALHAKLKDVDAKIAAARTQNAALQAQVTQLEQQGDAQQKQLQQRDDEIAALQKKLQVAGVPASTASAGH